MQTLKRLGRYLKGRPRVVQRFVRQREPTRIDAYGDSDNAGDPESRRSTVGQIIMLGQHTVKHSCNLISQIGLSSVENEYYAITSVSATGLGIQSLLRDWHLEMSLTLHTDSSAAQSFTARRGLGKMKHIQTRFLWTQERVAAGHLKLVKVHTKKIMQTY